MCVGLTEHCRARSQADPLPSQEWKPITDIICPTPNISLMKLNRAASLPRMHTAQQVQPWPQLDSFTDLAACSLLSAVPSHRSFWPHLLQENLFCFFISMFWTEREGSDPATPPGAGRDASVPRDGFQFSQKHLLLGFHAVTVIFPAGRKRVVPEQVIFRSAF